VQEKQNASVGIKFRQLTMPTWAPAGVSADLHVHMNYGGHYRNTLQTLAAQARAEHELRDRRRARGDLATRESSIAKYFAGEVCNRAAQATADIFGGAAFSDDLPIGLYLNYAKLWQTGEGSANVQKIMIAEDALDYKIADRHHGKTGLRDIRKDAPAKQR